jgi:pyruvate/2-oxoglutarate dehydrogenase complex dihydrolipoamide acyltransferase (E2) component
VESPSRPSKPPAVSSRKRRLKSKSPTLRGPSKQKAQELGVDLSQLKGTDPRGRITVKDVIGAAD